MPAARSEFFPNARPSAPPNARPASVKQTVETATVANSGASGNRSEGNAKPTPRESRLIESEAKIIPLGFSTSNSCPPPDANPSRRIQMPMPARTSSPTHSAATPTIAPKPVPRR